MHTHIVTAWCHTHTYKHCIQTCKILSLPFLEVSCMSTLCAQVLQQQWIRHLCTHYTYMQTMASSYHCLCVQVCWYWKYLAECHELWQPKCLRLGWFLPTPPSQYDCSAWKRHYVACVCQLHWSPPQVRPLLSTPSPQVSSHHVQWMIDLRLSWLLAKRFSITWSSSDCDQNVTKYIIDLNVVPTS